MNEKNSFAKGLCALCSGQGTIVVRGREKFLNFLFYFPSFMLSHTTESFFLKIIEMKCNANY